jgi:hypothetical protein
MAATVAPPDLSPLRADTCLGRQVLVPHSEYPEYPCTENGGTGWNANIIACTRNGHATVRYQEAATTRGIPYEDVQLQLTILSPI